METKIIKSNRKNCELQMRNPDKLIIKVPRKGSEEILANNKEFIDTWVALKTIGFKNYIKPENMPLNDTELEELYDNAYILFRERLDFYAEIMDTWFTDLQIKNYKSFMGCLKADYINRNITVKLNIALALVPVEILDAIIIHELCHTTLPYHDEQFYRKVLKYCPDYWERFQWLWQECNILQFRINGYTYKNIC